MKSNNLNNFPSSRFFYLSFILFSFVFAFFFLFPLYFFVSYICSSPLYPYSVPFLPMLLSLSPFHLIFSLCLHHLFSLLYFYLFFYLIILTFLLLFFSFFVNLTLLIFSLFSICQHPFSSFFSLLFTNFKITLFILSSKNLILII